MLRKFLQTIVIVCSAQAASAADLATVVEQLQPPERWLSHAERELLPWWRQPAALGDPIGRFPTFRCRDGGAYNASAPCDELRSAPAWIKNELGRNYVRMQARQVFAYAMGFHLSGDPRLLAWAEAGAADIRRRALDPESGSPATYFENGKPLPAIGERTAQDIAYAGIALASVYYLTRDPAIADDLDRLHKHLMTYWDPKRKEMRWTLAGPDKNKRELVAQLDPLNAYMVLTTPLLDGERRKRWQRDMLKLTKAIRTHYCTDEALARCAGTLHESTSRAPGSRHNDFGHSGKAFWMLGLAGRQLNDKKLKAWADRQAQSTLKEAYIAATGSWASRWREQGVEAGKSWWIYAELDQLASTLALQDASYAQYLARTWPFWLDYFVDKAGYEVWGGVSASGLSDPKSLKQHHWKNGYHSLEHAVISYLASSALQGKPATLYYADSVGAKARLQPYLFDGVEQSRARADGVLAVRFSLPRPALDGAARFELPQAQPEAALPLNGERVAITAEMLPTLLGVWEGEWSAAEAGAKGVFEIDIQTLTESRIAGKTSAFGTPDGEKEIDRPLDLPVRIENGALISTRPDGREVALILSREKDELWLQWKDFFGIEVVFRVSPRPK